MTLTQLGITTVPLHCRAPDFLPSLAECEQLVTPRTRAVVLVSPNNPTGALYPPALIAQYAQLAQNRGIALVLDETYADFVPDGARPHELFVSTAWQAYLIRLTSMSKSYAIPGHRLGAVVASQPFLVQLQKVLDSMQICPARPAQTAIAWAVEGVRPWRESVRDELQAKQARFAELMEQVPGWKVMVGSAYFAWVEHPFAGVPSAVVAQKLGEQVGLVVLPGECFFVRFPQTNCLQVVTHFHALLRDGHCGRLAPLCSPSQAGFPRHTLVPGPAFGCPVPPHNSSTEANTCWFLNTGSFFGPPFDDVSEDRFIRFCECHRF